MIPAEKIFWKGKPLPTLSQKELLEACAVLFTAYHNMMTSINQKQLPSVKDFLQQLGADNG